jgi:hypothetical protein
MNLSEDEAYFLCERIIDKVKMHRGDLCLLWHNSNPTNNPWHKTTGGPAGRHRVMHLAGPPSLWWCGL